MRAVIAGLLILNTVSVGAEATWTWHEPCSVEADATRCEVWFNSIERAGDITVSVDSAPVEAAVVPWESAGVETANAILLHVPGSRLERQEKRDMKKSIGSLLASFNPAREKLALFASGQDGLEYIDPGFLDESSSTLQQNFNGWNFPESARDPLANLVDLIRIVGSNQETPRKVLYWLTTALNPSAEQVRAISTAAAEERIRLVTVHLIQSELDENSSSALRQLGAAAPGLYLQFNKNLWGTGHPGAYSEFSRNGRMISFDNTSLCGERTLSFSANLGSASVRQDELLSFRPCEAEAEAPDEVALTDAETPEDTPAPVEADPTDAETPEDAPAPVEADPTDAETPEDAPAPVEAAPTDAETPEDAPSPVEAGPAGEEAAEGTGMVGVSFSFLAAFGLGIVLLVALVILIRRNNRQKTGSAKPEESAGVIVIEENGQLRRHVLTGFTTRIGRSTENDIVLTDDSVSAFHVLLKVERDGRLWLTDLNSSNYSFVNGVQVTHQALSPGDVIRLGAFSFTCEAV